MAWIRAAEDKRVSVSQLEELTLIPFHALWISTEQFLVMPQIPASGLFQWTQVPFYFSWGRLSMTQTKAFPIRTAAVDSEFRRLSVDSIARFITVGNISGPSQWCKKDPGYPSNRSIYSMTQPQVNPALRHGKKKAFSWSAYNLWTEWLVGKWFCLQRLEEVPVTSNS